jgi:ubiquinone/menaquinone biosynthesis C-methylase UbiE
MGFYQEQIVPLLINLAMRQGKLAEYRRRVVPAAEGHVLEIGIGSGLNLPFYSHEVDKVIGLDPSPKLLSMAQHQVRPTAFDLEFIEGTAEAMPIESASIDTVVTTWTMCSIPDVRDSLTEMRRVLKPTGRLLFVEHGRAPEARVQWWQDQLTPAWKRVSGGCHLNRQVEDIIRDAGFRIEPLEKGYMRGPKPMTFMYEGRARSY